MAMSGLTFRWMALGGLFLSYAQAEAEKTAWPCLGSPSVGCTGWAVSLLCTSRL